MSCEKERERERAVCHLNFEIEASRKKNERNFQFHHKTCREFCLFFIFFYARFSTKLDKQYGAKQKQKFHYCFVIYHNSFCCCCC